MIKVCVCVRKISARKRAVWQALRLYKENFVLDFGFINASKDFYILIFAEKPYF